MTAHWMGPGRSVFMDLSAGPFSWGPVVGGEGVMTHHTLPDVATFASIHQSTKYKELHPEPVSLTPVGHRCMEHVDRAYQLLTISDRLVYGLQPEYSDDIYHDMRQAMADFDFANMQEMQKQHGPNGSAAANSGAGEAEKEDALYDWDTIEAERVVNEDFLQKQCRPHLEAHNTELQAQCKEMRAKQADLEKFIAEYKPGNKVRRETFEGRHAFSWFNDGFQEGHSFNLEAQHFMSHLAASLSTTLSQVVTPAVADHAGSFAQRVTFHIYVLINHNKYDPLQGGFIGQLKSSLDTLRLAGQEFVFVTHKLRMADDPTLAMAFTTSLKSTVVPALHLNGEFSAIKRLYIDSELVQHELVQLQSEREAHPKGKASANKGKGKKNQNARTARAPEPEPPAAAGAGGAGVSNNGDRRSKSGASGRGKAAAGGPGHAHSRRYGVHQSRDIPIFIFSLDLPLPVFIDKHLQSRALDNMVIAVQSNQHLWESHLQCNQRSIYWNLRDPTRSIVASVAGLLGGLMPLHITHSTAHKRTVQDWMWAVGSSPMSNTGNGLQFSRMQADTIHRNYVISAIMQATSAVNTAVLKLQQQPTTVTNEVLRILDITDSVMQAVRRSGKNSGRSSRAARLEEERKHPRLRHIRATYRLVKRQLTLLYSDLDHLDFAKAVPRLRPLLNLSNRYGLPGWL